MKIENCEDGFKLKIGGEEYSINPCPSDDDVVSKLIMDTIRSIRTQLSEKEKDIYFHHGARRKIREREIVRKSLEPVIGTLREHLKIIKGEKPGNINFERSSEGGIAGININSDLPQSSSRRT